MEEEVPVASAREQRIAARRARISEKIATMRAGEATGTCVCSLEKRSAVFLVRSRSMYCFNEQSSLDFDPV